MSKFPLISVYVPTYNRVHLLQRAVDSVLNQSYKNIELLIVDDGSTDGTLEYLGDLVRKDRRVRVLEKKGSKGAPASRNIAIREAKGVFITGLDDDDFFEARHLATLYGGYNSKYACSFVRKANWKDVVFSPVVFFTRRLSFGQLVYFNMIGNQIFTETWKLRDAGGFKEGLEAAQDYEAWLRLLNKFGKARMLISSSYKMDVSHGAPRISDNRRRAIKTYRYICGKYGFTDGSKEMDSFDLRCFAISGEGRFPYRALLNLRNYRYVISMVYRLVRFR